MFDLSSYRGAVPLPRLFLSEVSAKCYRPRGLLTPPEIASPGLRSGTDSGAFRAVVASDKLVREANTCRAGASGFGIGQPEQTPWLCGWGSMVGDLAQNVARMATWKTDPPPTTIRPRAATMLLSPRPVAAVSMRRRGRVL